jgi:hypothetical protein
MVNIAEQNPALVRELVADELNPWLERMADPWMAA